ncbi:MAG: N-acetylglucosamine-6-phosphate deacetylase [Terriglobales bacterium]
MVIFRAARILTPEFDIAHSWMAVEDGRVTEILSGSDGQFLSGASLFDFGDGVIVPGYIDLHIHGNAGYDVMDDRAEALPTIERMLARHGVTGYFPTTVSAPLDSTLHALDRLAKAIEQCQRGDAGQPGRATPLGIHLEGPFISHACRGVHPSELLLPPRIETFERFWQAARGHIRMMTIAPELDGALELIRAAAARGVCVSLGHSDADFSVTESAIAAGATHATHVFNAMRPLAHRDPGILGAVLSNDRVSADLIVDGIHLDPSIVKLVARCKGAERTVLITDATAATGMPDGRYRLGSIDVDVKNGACTSGGKLAGSVLTMDKAVHNFSHFSGCTMSEAIAAASRNPARLARLSNKGELKVGADADFIVLNNDGDVTRTFIRGVECVRSV